MTIGRFMALPKMFMPSVPVLRRSVAGLFNTFLTDYDSTCNRVKPVNFKRLDRV